MDYCYCYFFLNNYNYKLIFYEIRVLFVLEIIEKCNIDKNIEIRNTFVFSQKNNCIIVFFFYLSTDIMSSSYHNHKIFVTVHGNKYSFIRRITNPQIHITTEWNVVLDRIQ